MLPTDRFPLITTEGAQRLRWLQEHPHAPRYTHPGVDKLTPTGLQHAQAFATEVATHPPRWQPNTPPAWVMPFVAECFRDVPFYRRQNVSLLNFHDLSTTSRADLNREPWAFVPDSQPLDNLIVYNTSGTTGHPLSILTHPDTLALYVPLLQAALAAHGIDLQTGSEGVAIMLVCYQQKTYTYAAVSAVLGQAGFIKLNLNPMEWRDPTDRAAFLDACQAQVYTGDPLAFSELARLPLTTRPKALVSTALTLTAGLQRDLETRFACPVLDLYSLNESGPISVKAPNTDEQWLLQPRLYVEIVDEDDTACEPGERGEIALTGGFNPFLPLVRYRTGDYARMIFRGEQPLLVAVEGRPPVIFRSRAGLPINNVDVSNALRPLPLAQYTLHQFADGRLRLSVCPPFDPLPAQQALTALFGADQPLTIDALSDDAPTGKQVQYTCDFDE